MELPDSAASCLDRAALAESFKPCKVQTSSRLKFPCGFWNNNSTKTTKAKEPSDQIAFGISLVLI